MHYVQHSSRLPADRPSRPLVRDSSTPAAALCYPRLSWLVSTFILTSLLTMTGSHLLFQLPVINAWSFTNITAPALSAYYCCNRWTSFCNFPSTSKNLCYRITSMVLEDHWHIQISWQWIFFSLLSWSFFRLYHFVWAIFPWAFLLWTFFPCDYFFVNCFLWNLLPVIGINCRPDIERIGAYVECPLIGVWWNESPLVRAFFMCSFATGWSLWLDGMANVIHTIWSWLNVPPISLHYDGMVTRLTAVVYLAMGNHLSDLSIFLQALLCWVPKNKCPTIISLICRVFVMMALHLVVCTHAPDVWWRSCVRWLYTAMQLH